jgi:hypothetical protein
MSMDIKSTFSAEHLSRSQRMVFDVLIGLHANGHQDATDSEIQASLERLYAPRRFDRSWISGRVADMKSAQVVIESQQKRHDANTRFIAGATGSAAKVRAVYVPQGLRPARPQLRSDIGSAGGGGVEACY